MLCGESATVLAHQGAEHRLEVTAGQPFEVQAREQTLLRLGLALVAVHDLRMESVDAFRRAAHRRHAHAHSAHARPNGALRQVTVPTPTKVHSADATVPVQEFLDLRL